VPELQTLQAATLVVPVAGLAAAPPVMLELVTV
jgi:hypothetical protein